MDLSINEGKRIVAAKIAGSVAGGGSPARVINAFIQVKDYQGLDRYLSKHKIPGDILTSALQHACMSSDSEAVGMFAKHGANVNYVDQFGTTLLHFAMRGGGDESVIKSLVAHGLDYSAWRSDGMPLLHWACSIGLVDLVEYLVDHSNASLQEADDNGRLPIHVAAVFGQPVVLSNLIRVLSTRIHPASVPAQFLAALSGDDDDDAIEEEEEEEDRTGQQAEPGNSLHPENKAGNRTSSNNNRKYDLLNFIPKPKSNIQISVARTVAAANYLDVHQWTPLHHASCEEAVNYFQDCLKILLDNGADPMLPTLQGKTALDLAYASGRSQILVDVLPKPQFIALLMRIDDIVPFEVRKRHMEEEKQREMQVDSCTAPPKSTSKLDLSPGPGTGMGSRTRKGYSFIRRLADNMDSGTDFNRSQLRRLGKVTKTDTTNLMSVWRKILLNDNVELLETLRDSLVWRQSKYDHSTMVTDFSALDESLPMHKEHNSQTDFETGQHLSMKQMSELFADCYENGTGVFSHVQATYQNTLKGGDFRTVLQSMTGLLTFNPLSTNKVVILKPMYKSLLFLAIICGRFRVAEQLIRMRQFDVLPASVLVTLILRRLHKQPSFPQQVLSELNNFADRVEAIAVDTLNMVFLKDNTAEKMICRSMLSVPLRTFGGLSLIDLCAKAKCTNLLSLPCCQRLLDERWQGVLFYLPPWLRWTSKFLPFTSILYLEYKAKQERTKGSIARGLLNTYGVGNKSPYNTYNDPMLLGGLSAQRTDNIKSIFHRHSVSLGHAGNVVMGKRSRAGRLPTTISFIQNQTPEPLTTIYDRIASQFGWQSSPRWHFVAGIYRSPSMKFLLHSIFHLLFLLFFSYVCVRNLHTRLGKMELIALSYVAGYALEEIRQILIEAWRDGLSDYFKDGWNWIDLVAIGLTAIGFIIRMNVNKVHDSLYEEAHDSMLYATRNLYMLGLNVFYIRTLYITSISPIIGPRLKMMADMLRKDLIPLLIVFVIFISSFGVWFQGIIYPNGFYETYQSRNIRTLSDMDRDKQQLSFQESLSELFRRAFYSIFEVSIVLDEETCDDNNKYCGSETGFNIVIFLVLVLYTGIVNIILINLLIALFSNTVSRIDQKSTAHWLAGRYKMVKEYTERTLLPPPLNTLCILYEILKCCYIGITRSRCRKHKKSQTAQSLKSSERSTKTTDAESDSSDFETSSYSAKSKTKESRRIQRKWRNNHRLKTFIGELPELAKSEKTEADAVLKFILLQSFALQNRRQTLGSGISGWMSLSNSSQTSATMTTTTGTTSTTTTTTTNTNAVNTTQPGIMDVKTFKIEERLDRLESLLQQLLEQTNQDRSKQSSPRIATPYRIPSLKWTGMNADTQTTPTRIPMSKELFDNLADKRSLESSPTTSSQQSPMKTPTIVVHKSSRTSAPTSPLHQSG